MPQEHVSPKPSFVDGSPNPPESNPPQSQLSATSETAPTLEPEIEELITSARKTGYAEAIADVTGILVEVARLKDAQDILITLARRFDALSKKGPSHYA